VSLAHQHVLCASTNVAVNAAAPDEVTPTSERRRASKLVVAPSAAQRVAVGLTEPADLGSDPAALSSRPPDTPTAACSGTVVGRLVDVDQLFLGDPPPVVALPLPSPPSTPVPGGARLVAVGLPDE